MIQTNSLTFLPKRQKIYAATGKDSLRFLQGMCTADLRRSLSAVQSFGATAGATHGYFLTLKGKILSPSSFCVFSEERILFTLAVGFESSTKEALERLIVADDVELNEMHGATAFEFLSNEDSTLHAKLKIEHDVPGASDLIWRVEKNGEAFLIPLPQLGPRHNQLWFEKTPSSQNWKWLDQESWKKLRIQSGCPEWNIDYNQESYLLEFPLQSFISYHKGCYLGQEVVARGTYRGHVNRAFSLFSSDRKIAEDFIYSPKDPERPVGKITTAFENSGQGLLRLSALEETKVFIQKTPEGEEQTLLFEKAWIPHEK